MKSPTAYAGDTAGKQWRDVRQQSATAKSVLSDMEQLYIRECFVNHTYELELIDMLGFSSVDSKAFKKLKKSAVFKFADFLDLLVEKE